MTPSYWARRARRHLMLASAGTVGSILVYAMADDKPTVAFKASMAFGYASLALLALTLAIGPWRVLHGRPSPVSTDLRRDVGIWSALLAIAHVVTGLAVHMRGQFWLYFFPPPEERHAIPLRLDGFGLANHTGLAATLLLVLLLAISNDIALRRLGARRWKLVQRLNYAAAAFVALHGAAYVYMDKRATGFVLFFVLLLLGSGGLQVAGARRIRAARRVPASQHGTEGQRAANERTLAAEEGKDRGAE